jgi:peptide/nickel transport system substrate-binding protein
MQATRQRTPAVALVAALILGACGGGSTHSSSAGTAAEHRVRPAGEPKHGGRLTVLWTADVDSLDPGETNLVAGLFVVRATQRPCSGSGRATPPVQCPISRTPSRT